MIKHKIYEDLIEKKTKLAVVGLGYVGLPIAHAFTQKVDVIGFDINEEKIDIYKMGIDPTNEIGDEAISHSTIEFTSNSEKLGESSFLIVAVPTPVLDFIFTPFTGLLYSSRITPLRIAD